MSRLLRNTNLFQILTPSQLTFLEAKHVLRKKKVLKLGFLQLANVQSVFVKGNNHLQESESVRQRFFPFLHTYLYSDCHILTIELNAFKLNGW